MNTDIVKKTRDLWFASFLVEIKGCIITEYKETSNRVYFYFLMNDEDWRKFKLEFNNSNFSKLKWGMEKLKDLIN